MPIDLNQCDEACTGCVRSYKKKHRTEPKFEIACKGIPLEYVPKKLLAVLPESEVSSAIQLLDPVSWASAVLDWHCIDPDGAIWKRKSEQMKLPQGVPNFFGKEPGDLEKNIARAAAGKSPFHRPYQAEMLRCTSKKKVFRIGRQTGKTETLVVSMLHAIFTNRDFNVLLITPYQAQIDMIFTRIGQFIFENPLLYNSKNQMIKAPTYKLSLHNGSIIRGFTAGTQSKGDAAQARGQTAHMIVFDEADYLSVGDLESALAVILNFPEATVWMSSTPTGRREKFYEICHSKDYREFYFPSQVNPNWTEELDKYFRSTYTEAGYQHEIKAEFGEIQEGVFRSGHVDAAMSYQYKYDQMKKEDGWRYCIGVDWNDVKIGTTICVVGWYSADNHFYIVERKVVRKDGWTQMAACEEIVKLNRKWLPDYIYIDKGFGSTQHEILRKFGHDARTRKGGAGSIDGRLAKIVKSYDFGSQIEIRDLFSRQPVKKHAKPFLVENSVRRFETHQIHISHEDKQLESELRGYIIDRVSVNGLPVYKQGNEKVGDHNLDALMLALVAFELELTDFGRPNYSGKMGFSGNFGQVTDAPLGVGSITIGNDYKRKEAATAKLDTSRPELNRTNEFREKDPITAALNPSSTQIPAANTTLGETSKPRLWSWSTETPRHTPKKSWVKSVRAAMKPPSRKKF